MMIPVRSDDNRSLHLLLREHLTWGRDRHHIMWCECESAQGPSQKKKKIDIQMFDFLLTYHHQMRTLRI